MEFHLLNEREIKTIRPRTSARSCLQARSRARVRPPRHSLIFTLGILDPETTFDSSVGFNFFRAALFIPPIPHLSLSPRRSFIAASFTVRLPLTILAAPSSLSPSEREREREGEPSFLSLSSSRRVRVYSRPILSRRRHFAPFIDPAPTHSPAFPATFLSPDEPAACTSCSPLCPSLRLHHQRNIAGFRIAAVRTERLTQIATVRELIRLCSLSSTRSRTRFETDLHRATEDRIETPLKREGEKR